jgi:broad specificity phosphatase PhoE
VSQLYLIRHGEAAQIGGGGLTELGRKQAALLAGYCGCQKLFFTAIYSGTLARQLETAREFCEASRRERFPVGELIEDPGWNEIEVAKLYQELAGPLSRDDAEFRKNLEIMQSQDMHSESRPLDAIAACHTAIVRAWIQNRYPFTGMPWRQYWGRLAERQSQLARAMGPIAIFTSITPITIYASLALKVSLEEAGVIGRTLYHTGFTVFDTCGGGVQLVCLNEVSHLAEPAMRTII